MMRHRYAVITGIGVPILLVTLGMLARTELVIGDRVRAAVEARARAAGADVEILTVGPSGLFGVELERVSARVPRGDFALELDLESVVITPTFGSLFGDIAADEVEVHGGVVAIVPWSEPVKRPASKASPPASDRQTPNNIAVTLDRLQVVALNDAYRSYPLDLARVQFVWSRGQPVTNVAGYGHLPDGVAFSIVAQDGAYRVQPQARTSIDRWVEPPAEGVRWPVSLAVRDIRLCPGCENVVALEDVELGLGGWRDDVRITAPVAEVHRKGRALSLGAPEMALVDATTRDFAVRITESSFSYALDSGHLHGQLELASADGAKLRSSWKWDAEDFVVDFDAADFPLASVWHLAPLGDQLRPGRMTGTAQLGWDMRHATLGLKSDLELDRLILRVPYTGEVLHIDRGRFELDLFIDARGRTASVSKAAVRVGDALPLVGVGHVVDAGDGFAFQGKLHLPEQDVSTLQRALPEQWTGASSDAELRGTFGFDLEAAGHSAFSESLVLDGELLGEVTVVRDGRADVRSIGKSGRPPMLNVDDWTPISSIGRRTWEVVLAAEDAKFMSHDGFDWIGIQRAMVHNLRERRPVRGGSTISQQVAKNLFLDGERTVGRKLHEAYLTWRLESVLSKRRILEIYLNLAEWGSTVRGISGAAHHYFGVAPGALSPVEVAMLAAILPNPHRFGGWIDEGRIATSRLGKIERILRNLKFLEKITVEEYKRQWIAAKKGRVGRLRLTPCDDQGKGGPSCKQ